MAVKNNRRTIITKKILKDSLLELMQTKPISKITIKEINLKPHKLAEIIYHICNIIVT